MEHEWILLDSSVWIQVFKKNAPPKLKQDIAAYIETGRMAINPIIMVEILQGAKSQKEYELLFAMLSSLYQLDLSPDLWRECHRLAFHLRKSGLNIPLTDIIIATSAIYYHALLIHDDSHFESIRGMEKRLSTVSYPSS